MPTRSVHERLSKLILGDGYGSVHAWKDDPVRRMGARHREVRHGPIAAFKTGRRFQGSGGFNFGAAMASIIHDLQDGHATTWLAVIGGSILTYEVASRLLRNNSSQASYVRWYLENEF